MATVRAETPGTVRVSELLDALGVSEKERRKLSPPGTPGERICIDAALRWLDAVAEGGGVCGVRARFLRVRLILDEAGGKAGM